MTRAEQIAAEIEALTPAKKLRLAADLIEQKAFAIALPIVRRIADELEVVTIVKREVEAETGSQEP